MSGINVASMMDALHRLKGIPLAKVIRNASRDFVQGAFKATPTAQISKSEYYKAEKDGKTWYIPASQLAGRRIKQKNGLSIKKVRIRKGWSKYTWVGVMRELGMASKNIPARLGSHVAEKSQSTQSLNATNPKVVISDEFQINNFGKTSTQPQHEAIAKAGFALATKRLLKEYTRLLKEAWK